MNEPFSASIKLIPRLRVGVLFGGMFLSLLGCSRSAVVMTPENNTLAEESASVKPLARAQTDEGNGEKSSARAGADESASKKPSARAAKNDTEAAPFRFPEDSGGRLLAKVLQPKDAEPARRQPLTSPTRRGSAPSSASAYGKLPTLPLPSASAALPRLAYEARRVSLRPTLVLDETLGGMSDAPVLPQVPSLPEGRRVRVASLDVNEPIPLPILARPMSDRASLDDPTLEASAAAAIAASIPSRTNMAPFLKLTLPDPYDRRRTDVPALEEAKEFPLGSPQLPPR